MNLVVFLENEIVEKHLFDILIHSQGFKEEKFSEPLQQNNFTSILLFSIRDFL